MNSAALPSPVELGFHARFQDWYPSQITAIDKVILGTKRFTALAMPTGSGKSLTGIASALLHGKVKRALYLTSTKGLQDQLHADFGNLGLVDVRGQRNYPCHAVESGQPLAYYYRGRRFIGCDEGPCHAGVFCAEAPSRAEPTIRPVCGYYGAVFDARRAELVSSNYAMWFSSSTYSQGLGDFDMLILDEAHDADKELESFLTLDLTLDDVHYIGSKFLKTDVVSDWRDWAGHHAKQLASTLERREAQTTKDIEAIRDLRQLKSVYGKLQKLAGVDPISWLIDLDNMRARFAPTRVAAYAEECLFRKVPHVLLMSATMTRKTTQLLGIPSGDLSFWECPSTFPVERRPIININTYPAVRVNARMHEDDKYMWMRRIDRYIEPRLELNWKGIVHAVSYERAKYLKNNSEHREWMLIHDAANTREMIQQFKALQGPWILVSPSIVTGYDFPGDQCRYQIIAKVPIPDMRGAIMAARAQLDPDYSGYLAMQKLVQACGRPVRGPLDWAETAIVDDTFSDWFFNKHKKHAPVWFREALQYVESYPDPMEVD